MKNVTKIKIRFLKTGNYWKLMKNALLLDHDYLADRLISILGPQSGADRKCRVCNHAVSTEKLLAEHFCSKHPSESPYQCFVCGQRFANW
jgi:hypothetical protein